MHLNQLERQLPSLKSLSAGLDRLVQGHLWVKVLIGLGLGVITGVLLGPDLALVSQDTAMVVANWLALPGKLFLALVQMIVVPLVFASIVRGLTASSDINLLKQMGLRSGLFFLAMTVLASLIGLSLAGLINPGHYVDREAMQHLVEQEAVTADVAAFALPSLGEVPTRLMGLLPANPLQSMVNGEMLQVILFAVIVGIALISMDTDKSGPIFSLVVAVQELCMKVVSWAMKLAPYAVFGLVARLTAMVGLDILTGMLVYMVTVVLGLLLLALIYLLIVRLLSGMTARVFLQETRELLLLAFSTSSSAAVMPLSLQTAESRLKVPEQVTKFVIPLGATVNMTGTALYQGVAVVFLSQVFAVDLDVMSLVLVVFMSVAAAVGSPATPGAGIVILAMILESVGIPSVGVALLLGVDRILDMVRTVVNVMGDLCACLLLRNVRLKVPAVKAVPVE
ncbi:dicarboxylate/amino acid:cation symporter [Pseudomaricurvus sp. HS19]|uniref:dicarboxylate/amino acid:cation symporter n=1 Tax=Pseudomaricurvus sp. HS19 TaxID=2692626 RepID=UPI00351A39AD